MLAKSAASSAPPREPMSAQYKLEIFCRQQSVYAADLRGPVELGRQQRAGEPLYRPQPGPGCVRVAIARLDETMLSRSHVRLEPLAEGRVRLTNLSTANLLQLEDASFVSPGTSCEVAVPALVTVADRAIRLEPADDEEPASELRTLAQPTLAPHRDVAHPQAAPHWGLMRQAEQTPEAMVAWLQSVVAVLQSAAGSTDFFQRAVEAVVNLVGLDCGSVLLLEGEQWRTVAQCFSPTVTFGAELRPSARMLAQMREQRRTFWQVPEQSRSTGVAHSLLNVEAVVVSPLLDPQGEVLGAIYGDRRTSEVGQTGPSISKLEAMLVETLACGVAAGLSRLDQERKLLEARVQFEQFFTPELARQLTVEPDLLKGRDMEVTLLFCDIRGFSRISDRVGPARTVEWVGDVMNVLSEFVLGQQGVLVDYIGDELIAMWGAPLPQPDQAQRACRVALEMSQAVAALDERWHSRLGERFSLGIGINTGIARVGNTGSQRKFKYGPLGPAVNLASRVQGATKYLKCGVVVTAATRRQLDDSFPLRRLGKVRVVNIPDPVELFELSPRSDAAWTTLCRQYEEGLRQFEARDFRRATGTLGRLLADVPDDGPALILLSRAVNMTVNPDGPFSEAWELPGK